MHLRSAATAFVLTFLGACGGDGGGSQVPLTTVTGTVATNVPIAGSPVSVFAPVGPPAGGSPGGGYTASGTTGPDGRYAATSFLGTFRPFFIISGTNDPHYPGLQSVSQSGDRVNVTPLTSLLVARLLNRVPASFDLFVFPDLQNRTLADVSAARQQVVAYLLNRPSKDDGNATSPVDVSAVTDFVSMPLSTVPGDPHFDALKRFHDSLMDSESIRGVQEHMLFGNDAPADLLAMLTLDFIADCTVQGPNNGTMPSGPTRIVLDRRAITLGSVDLAFQTGDQLQITAGPAREGPWFFIFAARQASVELDITAGRLTRVLYGLPNFVSSACVPQSSVSVSDKRPSVFGLIGLLRQSISVPREFQCAGPITFPGFLAAPNPNVLLLDPNGAVRVNGPGGPSLYLPSMAEFFVGAQLVVNSGQVSPIRLTSFSADYSFSPGDFDGFSVRLTDAGQITGLGLTNAHSQQAQSCGI